MANENVDLSPPSKYVISGILDTVAYNVARKNKLGQLYEIGKVFEQRESKRRTSKYEIQFCAFLDRVGCAERDFQTAAVPVDFFYAKNP